MEQIPEGIIKNAAMGGEDLLPQDRIEAAVAKEAQFNIQTKNLAEAMSEAAKNETIVRFCEKYPTHPLAKEIYEKLQGKSLAGMSDFQIRMAGPEGDIEDAYDQSGSVVSRRESSYRERGKDSTFLAEYASYFWKIEAALTPEEFAELMKGEKVAEVPAVGEPAPETPAN